MSVQRVLPLRIINQAVVFALSFVLAVPPSFGQSNSGRSSFGQSAQNADTQSGKESSRAADSPTPQQNTAQQNKDSVATIAVDVNVVALPVTVRDKHGAIVKDLTKDDFTLQEDGRPQAIKYFSLDSNLPLGKTWRSS